MKALTKICNQCGKQKRATLNVFYASPTARDGLQSRCKECVKAAAAARWMLRRRCA